MTAVKLPNNADALKLKMQPISPGKKAENRTTMVTTTFSMWETIINVRQWIEMPNEPMLPMTMAGSPGRNLIHGR